MARPGLGPAQGCSDGALREGLPVPAWPRSIALPQRRDVLQKKMVLRNGISFKNWDGFKKSLYSFYWAKKKYCFLLVFLPQPFSISSSLSQNGLIESVLPKPGWS